MAKKAPNPPPPAGASKPKPPPAPPPKRGGKAPEAANKYERFTTRVIDRSQIQSAYYNPRKISESAKKKLKAFLKKSGLLSPLVWNERTGNIVSGHQRLGNLDELHGGKPYQLTVAVVDMDDAEEVKSNVFMNNTSAQGEWDIDKLHETADLFPDLDLVADFGFDEEELDIMGFELNIEDEGDDTDSDTDSDTDTEEDTAEQKAAQDEKWRETKKGIRKKAMKEDADGNGASYVRGDYTLTFIFPNADAKRLITERLGYRDNPARLHSDILGDLLKLGGK